MWNKNSYFFAKIKFELWRDAVDISEKYIEAINTKTWLNQDIIHINSTKLLYEYFQDELQTDEA
jgi:hypothetical protein